jgi:hypothetical protein
VACVCPGWLPLYAAVPCALAPAIAASTSATKFAAEKGDADAGAGGRLVLQVLLTPWVVVVVVVVVVVAASASASASKLETKKGNAESPYRLLTSTRSASATSARPLPTLLLGPLPSAELAAN